MGLFSTLLGTEGVVDSIREGADKAFLTAEERLDYHKQLLTAYEPFKIIQRYLALMVTSLFGFVVIVQVLMAVGGVWYPALYEGASVVNSLEPVQMLGWAFLSIMSLYFSGGVINSFRSKGN